MNRRRFCRIWWVTSITSLLVLTRWGGEQVFAASRLRVVVPITMCSDLPKPILELISKHIDSIATYEPSKEESHGTPANKVVICYSKEADRLIVSSEYNLSAEMLEVERIDDPQAKHVIWRGYQLWYSQTHDWMGLTLSSSLQYIMNQLSAEISNAGHGSKIDLASRTEFLITIKNEKGEEVVLTTARNASGRLVLGSYMRVTVNGYQPRAFSARRWEYYPDGLYFKERTTLGGEITPDGLVFRFFGIEGTEAEKQARLEQLAGLNK